ncbi:hypothetical protein [Microbacterium sp. Leaf288]|uniref:hypothetical protein n=1 Tax=Microbacterium sp. Leaf288 TaxID=1736323 RepID=UPI000A5EFC51|nr:hypothetical protein [Microbacterium sp. Leaf288]
MYLSNLAMIVRRRWILALVGLVFTAGLAVAGYYIAKPTYQATASVLLLPPASTVPAEGNPFLQLGGLDLTVDLLGKALSDQAVTRQIEAASPTAEAEVGPDPSSSGPIVRIQVQDKSEASALEVRDLLVAMVPPRLAELQSAVGVDGRNRVTSSVLVVDADAEPVGRDKLVGAVVGGIVGLGLSLILLVLLDNVLLRREARRIRARDALDEDDSDEPGVESAPEDAVEDLPPDRRGSTPLESDSSLRRHHRSVGEDDLERSLADADVPQPAAAVSEQS